MTLLSDRSCLDDSLAKEIIDKSKYTWDITNQNVAKISFYLKMTGKKQKKNILWIKLSQNTISSKVLSIKNSEVTFIKGENFNIGIKEFD